METLLQAFKTRRTNYALGKDVTVPDDTIIAMIQDIVREVPSAFNMQSGRVVIALGAKHDAIWQITMDTLRAIVPKEAFGRTEEKIKSFAAAYGTLLFFDDTAIVKEKQEQFPLYADNFPIWAQQANGMMQYALWTGLYTLGLGANLQHYNPLIDKAIQKKFNIPSTWQLIAQMPFGNVIEPANAIPKEPIEKRVLVAE